jgi:hypothetical protein
MTGWGVQHRDVVQLIERQVLGATLHRLVPGRRHNAGHRQQFRQMFRVLPRVAFLVVLGVNIDRHQKNPSPFLCHGSVPSGVCRLDRCAASRVRPRAFLKPMLTATSASWHGAMVALLADTHNSVCAALNVRATRLDVWRSGSPVSPSARRKVSLKGSLDCMRPGPLWRRREEVPLERSVATELSLARETSTTYHVLYRRHSEPGGAVTPWCLHGRDTLQVFLQQCESAGNMDRILTRVEAGLRDVLDLGSVDEERVARVFRHSAHGPAPGVIDPLAA